MHLKLREDIKSSLKAKDKETTMALRSIFALAQDIGLKENRKEITNDDVVSAAKKLKKEGEEGCEIYKVIDSPIADDNYARNFRLVELTKDYLPKQYTDEEMSDVVSVIIGVLEHSLGTALTMKDMGKVMKEVKSQLPDGSYDGKKMSDLVKEGLK